MSRRPRLYNVPNMLLLEDRLKAVMPYIDANQIMDQLWAAQETTEWFFRELTNSRGRDASLDRPTLPVNTRIGPLREGVRLLQVNGLDTDELLDHVTRDTGLRQFAGNEIIRQLTQRRRRSLSGISENDQAMWDSLEAPYNPPRSDADEAAIRRVRGEPEPDWRTDPGASTSHDPPPPPARKWTEARAGEFATHQDWEWLTEETKLVFDAMQDHYGGDTEMDAKIRAAREAFDRKNYQQLVRNPLKTKDGKWVVPILREPYLDFMRRLGFDRNILTITARQLGLRDLQGYIISQREAGDYPPHVVYETHNSTANGVMTEEILDESRVPPLRVLEDVAGAGLPGEVELLNQFTLGDFKRTASLIWNDIHGDDDDSETDPELIELNNLTKNVADAIVRAVLEVMQRYSDTPRTLYDAGARTPAEIHALLRREAALALNDVLDKKGLDPDLTMMVNNDLMTPHEYLLNSRAFGSTMWEGLYDVLDDDYALESQNDDPGAFLKDASLVSQGRERLKLIDAPAPVHIIDRAWYNTPEPRTEFITNRGQGLQRRGRTEGGITHLGFTPEEAARAHPPPSPPDRFGPSDPGAGTSSDPRPVKRPRLTRDAQGGWTRKGKEPAE